MRELKDPDIEDFGARSSGRRIGVEDFLGSMGGLTAAEIYRRPYYTCGYSPVFDILGKGSA